MNILPARLSDDGSEVLVFDARMPVSAAFRASAQRMRGKEVILGVRPEHIGVNHEVDWEQTATVRGIVEMVEPLGHESIIHLKVNDQVITGRLRSHRVLPAPGDEFTMQMKCDAMHLFNPADEQSLR
jgi:multiple sugar transport system ATP-binding protein